MPDDRSLVAWEHWHQSSEKLDYFILGISAALTAYVGQHLALAPLGVNPSTAQLLSLLLFAASVLAGLQRLRAVVTALSIEKTRLLAYQRAGQLKTLLLNPKSSVLVDSSSGQTYTLEQARAEAERSEKEYADVQKKSDQWSGRADRAYNLRDWFLTAGVVVYAASKVWLAIVAS